jgi:hypothetical protein
MRAEDQILELCMDIENQSSNLLDDLDDLNYHSKSEALRDLQQGVFRKIERMRTDVTSLLHKLDANGFIKNGKCKTKTIEDLQEIDALLDVMRKVNAEPKSYHHFLDVLAPLLQMLEKWTMEGLSPIKTEIEP